jgi:hypothetical protein
MFVAIGRAAFEESIGMQNLGTNSAFTLGPRIKLRKT